MSDPRSHPNILGPCDLELDVSVAPRLVLAFCAVAVSFALSAPILAQDSMQSNSTALDGFIQDQQKDAKRDLIEFSLDQLTSKPQLIQWGVRLNPNALEFTNKAFHTVGISNNVFDVWNALQNRKQRGEANYKVTNFLLVAASNVADYGALSAGLDFDAKLHEADLTYKAYEHNSEAQSLAFGGTMSHARSIELHFAPPEFDSFSGSFHSLDTRGPVLISGEWAAMYGNTEDRFDAWAGYKFNELQTTSGHVLSGAGSVSRLRVERHDPFQDVPLLRGVSLFNFNDPTNMTETTWRHESYNDSFNGALANQLIQRASEFNSHAKVSVPFNPFTPSLTYQGILKRPPSFDLPPLLPPPIQRAVSVNDKPEQQMARRVVAATHPVSPPSSAAGTPSSMTKPGGVMADIKISGDDFAEPKQGEKK